MAFMKVLSFDDEILPFPDSYDVAFSDIEAESSGETEAGTRQRDLVRQGVPTISVSFSVSPKWLERLSYYRSKAKINVKYFSPETLEFREQEMYIEGYKAKLEHDNSKKGLWSVSFTLESF